MLSLEAMRKLFQSCVCVCVFQFSQRRSPSGSAVRNHYHTHPAPCVRPRCVGSVCVYMYSFASLIRRTPPPTFSDTAITDATLIQLFSSSELTGCGLPGLLDRKNRSDMCPRWESNPRLPACKASTLSTRSDSPLFQSAWQAAFILLRWIEMKWILIGQTSAK